MVSSCSAGARLILDRGKARSLQTFLGPSRNGKSQQVRGFPVDSSLKASLLHAWPALTTHTVQGEAEVSFAQARLPDAE